MITKEEMLDAFQHKRPVLASIGTTKDAEARFERITKIIYSLDEKGCVHVSLELIDKRGNLTTVLQKNVRAEKYYDEMIQERREES